MATKNIVPRANGEGSIGTNVKRWLKGWFNNVDVSGDVDIGGNFVLPDSGTQALRSKNGANKIFPITSVGDMWQTSSGNWIVDANNFSFRDALGSTTRMQILSNGAVGINGTPSGSNWLEVIGSGGTSSIISKSTSTTTSPYIGEATNASFTGTMTQLNATRAASSDFYFAGMYSSGGGDIEFSMRGDGNAWADGAWNGGGADFAEYFEWADGNPNNEDRCGWSVVLEDGKIRKALAPEIPFGVISARPTVVGDAAEHKWADKYLKDDFNRYIMEDYEVVEWTETKVVQDETEEKTKDVQHSYAVDEVPDGVVVPIDATRSTQQRRKLNPNYDENQEYVPRSERPEWDCVGLMGKLRLVKGEVVNPNWIKMRDVSSTVEEWLVR